MDNDTLDTAYPQSWIDEATPAPEGWRQNRHGWTNDYGTRDFAEVHAEQGDDGAVRWCWVRWHGCAGRAGGHADTALAAMNAADGAFDPDYFDAFDPNW